MATLSDVYAHLKTLCEQWFYNKSTMDTYLANKANSSHAHGNITNDGKVGTTATKPLITGTGGVVQAGSFGTTAGTFCQGNDSRLSNARTPTAHNQGSDTITESNALSNLGTSAGATQQAINNALNTAIGNLSSIDAVNIVTTLPTASSSTLGKLYIISENSKVNVYYTEENNGTYSWEKLDDDILDELSVSWSDIKNKPQTFTPSGHSHYTSAVQEPYDLPNIGTPAGASQYEINDAINTTVGTINTNLGNKASSTHTHNNITNDGKVTVTGTNGGNLVVTNSSNEVIVESAIDVLDGVIQDLISYGAS